MEKNFYEILEIPVNAKPDEISKAYRKLVLKYHPDRIKDPKEKASAEETLKEITEAYNTLSNWKLRSEYDKTLSQPKPAEKSPAEKAKEYFAQAMDHYKKGEIKAAESLFAFILKLTPQDFASQFYLGMTKLYSPLSRTEGAKLVESALKADPYHPEWFITYAKILKKFQQDIRARKVIEEGIKANPHDFSLPEFLKSGFSQDEKETPKDGGILGGFFGKKS
ncbi:MAG: DnaJ domain-containing protein [Acidobacteria bacterium]|nr:DnaJ domain-containing protein [Acidobacteriota bacterium]